MENKYYTPEIEEFHVGFEFEVYDRDFSGNCYWDKQTMSMGYFMQSYNKDIFENNIKDFRVKYLDTKDIESLGWVEDKEFLLDDSTWFKLNSNYLRHYYHGELYIQNGNKEMIFNGVCKNKSELKRVLKQIGFKEIK